MLQKKTMNPPYMYFHHIFCHLHFITSFPKKQQKDDNQLMGDIISGPTTPNAELFFEFLSNNEDAYKMLP